MKWDSRKQYKPRHDKTNKMSMCPAKTQISLGICPVWPESSFCAQWVAKDPSFLHVDSEDWSDWADAQADPSLRWEHSHFVDFVMRQLILRKKITYETQSGIKLSSYAWKRWKEKISRANITYASSKDSDQPGHQFSLSSEEGLDPYLPGLQKTDFLPVQTDF